MHFVIFEDDKKKKTVQHVDLYEKQNDVMLYSLKDCWKDLTEPIFFYCISDVLSVLNVSLLVRVLVIGVVALLLFVFNLLYFNLFYFSLFFSSICLTVSVFLVYSFIVTFYRDHIIYQLISSKLYNVHIIFLFARTLKQNLKYE